VTAAVVRARTSSVSGAVATDIERLAKVVNRRPGQPFLRSRARGL